GPKGRSGLVRVNAGPRHLRTASSPPSTTLPAAVLVPLTTPLATVPCGPPFGAPLHGEVRHVLDLHRHQASAQGLRGPRGTLRPAQGDEDRRLHRGPGLP